MKPYTQYESAHMSLQNMAFMGLGGRVGGWKELARTTLGSAGNTIDVGSLPDKRYYQILTYCRPSGTVNGEMRLGNGSLDTGSNYAERVSVGGASDVTAVNQTSLFVVGGITFPIFINSFFCNLSTKEKLGISHSAYPAGSGSATSAIRAEYAYKWANTTDPNTNFGIVDSDTGSYDTDSEMVVLGWDPDDQHISNFWEELESANGDDDEGFSTGTFTAKKYLWIQGWIEPSVSSVISMTVNGDSGTNYSDRVSTDGGTDVLNGSQSDIFITGTGDTPIYFNMFVINVSATEKLFIIHSTFGTAGAGNAPTRYETVAKWVNTASQITSLDFLVSTGDLSANSIVKVWGHD